ncbi:reverse transcriptase N-terminal domain-containing protein [Okeania sp. SIO1I7]|uniref:reverse transcriptase N-terminal domain-containing protein n=1 Tax=Okeania sp. SIO1I7 TaxID=2607772 RepID=UPI003453DAA3
MAWDTDDIPSQTSINPTLKWKDINWKQVEKNLYKLQKLIYRASRRGKLRKMRKYQKLLTNSYYPMLLAIRRVTQDNQGKKTAGIDGIKNLLPMQRLNLVELLKTQYLKASPTRRVWIPKPGKNEKRPLGIPTMYDQGLQALIKLGIEPEWEARFELNSYGFRPGLSAHDAIQAIYKSIRQKFKYVLDTDISKCFDRINHDVMLRKIGKSAYRRLIKQWLKSSEVPIIRYIKVKGEKSPYDGEWTYWSNRNGKHPGIRKEVTKLLKSQKNKCAYCGLTFRPMV